MTQKKPKRKAGLKDQPEAESPEFAAFKELVGKVIAVPRDEIESREQQWKERKKTKPA